MAVSQKVEGFAVIIGISEFSPVSLRDGVLVFIKSAMPPITTRPVNFANFLPKLKVAAISSRGSLHD